MNNCASHSRNDFLKMQKFDWYNKNMIKMFNKNEVDYCIRSNKSEKGFKRVLMQNARKSLAEEYEQIDHIHLLGDRFFCLNIARQMN